MFVKLFAGHKNPAIAAGQTIYFLIEDAIAASDLHSLKRELEQVVAAACTEPTADGGAWDSAV